MTTPDRFPADPHDELRDCRNAIEVVDRRIVALLAQRVALALRAAGAKRAAGLSLVDRAREAEVIDRVAAEARGHDLPVDAVERVFESIIDMSRRAQEDRR
ncbi:MAG: chorismate mutase [Gemmatimonadaceae bacterium]|nr:chorismate mutase [Gemmatimonadaceae bacterium]NUP56632.1 chorismate mutase [Gemmatimonadaceae bacterium]NUP71425.1 chorismate mutase [Gemmatimonadaceae bacterium]NUR35019.1 chorismate mutase [Gemmatimonadaceae bacterium]NUS33395.1 chorismate mutase [Gemmatimonadaceae bacterium]